MRSTKPAQTEFLGFNFYEQSLRAMSISVERLGYERARCLHLVNTGLQARGNTQA